MNQTRNDRWWLAAMVLLVISPAGSVAQAKAIPNYPAPDYVELAQSFTSNEDFVTWNTITRRLQQDFDSSCGDTFCAGDYSNIQALRYVCSVRPVDGQLGQCLWSFAASNEDIDASSGTVRSDIANWRCPSPLAPVTQAKELLAALQVEHPLWAKLPHTQATLYDSLLACL